MIACLTQEQAEKRFSSFGQKIQYKIVLALKKGKKYWGQVQCDFELEDTKNVFVDFSGTKITSATINGNKLTEDDITESWKDGHLTLKDDLLKKGSNTYLITFDNDYNTDGNGLPSCTDSTGQQFIYTQSEPYWFNRVVPIFDQPDLKATAQFFFFTPNDWEILSNCDQINQCTGKTFFEEEKCDQFMSDLYKEQEQEVFTNDYNFTSFNPTEKISTYLMAFVAGPYKCIKYDDCDGPAPVPLQIFCSEQNYKYAQDQKRDIFLYYIKSIEFYEKFFQTKCQFKKFDTIFCPEYTVGAMEYPGLITYTDNFLFKQKKPTPNQVSVRGEVIAHELAHMWFGNYVTMKWWNDLWLNESFADFVCFLCLSFINKDMPFETVDSWSAFLKNKAWGYQEDKRTTTHPIAGVVENTSKADSIFDGITYSKGAAVLKQLYFLIGHENFSNNLKTYFEKYGWSNATLSQFLEEMSKFETKEDHKAYDIKNFNKDWIEKAGLNEITTEWNSDQQGKQTIKFRQSFHSEQHKTLRYNKMKFACFDENAQIVNSYDFILENKEETQVELDNNNYKAILPNYGDWGFIKVILDKQSQKFLSQNIHKVQDPLSILLILSSFMDTILDAKMRATDFISDLIQNDFLSQHLDNANILKNSLDYFQQAMSYIPQMYRDEFKNRIFDYILLLLTKTKNESSLSILQQALVNVGSTTRSVDLLKKILDDKMVLKLDFTIAQKWRIVLRINCSELYTQNEKEMYTNYMKQLDNSDTAKNYLTTIEALSEDRDKTQQLWETYLAKERQITYVQQDYSLMGFWGPFKMPYSRHQYIKQYFEALPNLCNNFGKQDAKTFLDNTPRFQQKKTLVEQFEKVLEQINPNQLYFKDQINKIIFDLKHMMKVESLYEQLYQFIYLQSVLLDSLSYQQRYHCDISYILELFLASCFQQLNVNLFFLSNNQCIYLKSNH